MIVIHIQQSNESFEIFTYFLVNDSMFNTFKKYWYGLFELCQKVSFWYSVIQLKVMWFKLPFPLTHINTRFVLFIPWEPTGIS